MPLPLIGSLYPLARRNGFTNQDISGRLYQVMVRSFERVFAQYPPLVMASGHDHDLQVIRGGKAEITHARYQLVSGAGILGHTGLVRKVEGSLFERDAAGFMRFGRHAGRPGPAVGNDRGAGGNSAEGRECRSILAVADGRSGALEGDY